MKDLKTETTPLPDISKVDMQRLSRSFNENPTTRIWAGTQDNRISEWLKAMIERIA